MIVTKFFKFFAVGFSGLIIDFTITWVSKEKLKIHKYVSNSLGFIIAVSSNYYLNRIWTFVSNSSEIFKEYTSFFIIAIIGLTINNLFLYLFHERFGKKFYTSKLIAILITSFWNFFANYYYTFS
jgi:putative flippase GtrA|tara:strand:+ start:38002 stop:38376 length:375 start_codon:yes stop_codon:yes gene_type:complete